MQAGNRSLSKFITTSATCLDSTCPTTITNKRQPGRISTTKRVVTMTAATAVIERYPFGGLLLAAVLVVSSIITPVLAQPSWATGNWGPGERGGGGRWWTGSYGTQNQGLGPGQGSEGQGRDQGGESPPPPPPPPHHGPGVVLSGTPRLGRAFKIFSVRPEGAKCNVDLYCNGCNWNDAYCTGSMTVIASDPACERACACVISGCPPRGNPR